MNYFSTFITRTNTTSFTNLSNKTDEDYVIVGLKQTDFFKKELHKYVHLYQIRSYKINYKKLNRDFILRIMLNKQYHAIKMKYVLQEIHDNVSLIFGPNDFILAPNIGLISEPRLSDDLDVTVDKLFDTLGPLLYALGSNLRDIFNGGFNLVKEFVFIISRFDQRDATICHGLLQIRPLNMYVHEHER